MRVSRGDFGTKLWLSARDTYDWAHRPGASWPCSELSGRPMFAEFDLSGDLVDVSTGSMGTADPLCPADEFNAITSDFLRDRFGPDHPAIRS